MDVAKIIRIIKSGRLKGAGYVTRIEDTRNGFKILRTVIPKTKVNNILMLLPI